MRLMTFLCLILTGLTIGTTPAAEPNADSYWVYFGTYTGKATGSRGIYRSTFDAKTGELSAPVVAAEVENPSFLEVAPSGATLYAVGETRGELGTGGSVYAYRIDPDTGGLTRISETPSGGADPCHVSTDAAGEFAIVSNYGGGNCAVFKLHPDGRIAARTTLARHQPDGDSAAAPHAHCGIFGPTGEFAYVADLGLDRVFVSALDRDTGKLTPKPPIAFPAGAGPRHLHLTDDGSTALVCGQTDMTVNVIRLDPKTGGGRVVQSLTTLPDGRKGPVKGYTTAEVGIHPNGKFVYVSNRGHDTIAAFGWDGAKLTAIGHVGDGIKTPRNFRIDPTGKWMLVANQAGGDVIAFAVDPDSGHLKPTGVRVEIPECVCVKFLAKP